MAGESIEYDLLAALIAYLGQAMACTPDGVPGQVRVNVGQVEDGGCDSLVASVSSVRSIIAGTSTMDALPEFIAPGHRGDDVGMAVEFAVTLARHCWPTDVQRDGDGEMTYNQSVGANTEAASAALLIDGRILHAALLHALAHPEVWWTDDEPVSFDWAIGARQPVRDVGCAGWTIPVVVEIGTLCPFVMCEPPEDEPVVPSSFVGDERTDVPRVAGSVDVRPSWMEG